VKSSDEEARWRLERELLDCAALAQRMSGEGAAAILTAVERITASFQAGGKLLLCGNGGSAADCQRMAAELVSRLSRERERPALSALALTTDTSFLTAYSNDHGFEGVFERQVEAHGRRGDVLIAISTSGNSQNVIRAVRRARAMGMMTIGLLGEGGALTGLVDCPVVVPSRDTQRIQEVLLCVEHILCDLTESALFP
jgi:D-sedoheptulose 7-phosphate isomerase